MCWNLSSSGMNGQRSEEVRRQQQQLLDQVSEDFRKTFSKLCFVKYLESMRWWYFIEPVLQFTSKSDESYHLREKCFQKSNSHSQTKRPEPSDGFLKYLEDEVSGRIADMEHPQCAEAIWYGATTEKGEQWKDTTKFKIWKMFCCLKQQSQNLLVQLCPPVFPFWQKKTAKRVPALI